MKNTWMQWIGSMALVIAFGTLGDVSADQIDIDVTQGQTRINNTQYPNTDGPLVKTGGGSLFLRPTDNGQPDGNSVPNLYEGGTTIVAGTIDIQNDGALGNVGGTLTMKPNSVSSITSLTELIVDASNEPDGVEIVRDITLDLAAGPLHPEMLLTTLGKVTFSGALSAMNDSPGAEDLLLKIGPTSTDYSTEIIITGTNNELVSNNNIYKAPVKIEFATSASQGLNILEVASSNSLTTNNQDELTLELRENSGLRLNKPDNNNLIFPHAILLGEVAPEEGDVTPIIVPQGKQATLSNSITQGGTGVVFPRILTKQGIGLLTLDNSVGSNVYNYNGVVVEGGILKITDVAQLGKEFMDANNTQPARAPLLKGNIAPTPLLTELSTINFDVEGAVELALGLDLDFQFNDDGILGCVINVAETSSVDIKGPIQVTVPDPGQDRLSSFIKTGPGSLTLSNTGNNWGDLNGFLVGDGQVDFADIDVLSNLNLLQIYSNFPSGEEKGILSYTGSGLSGELDIPVIIAVVEVTQGNPAVINVDQLGGTLQLTGQVGLGSDLPRAGLLYKLTKQGPGALELSNPDNNPEAIIVEGGSLILKNATAGGTFNSFPTPIFLEGAASLHLKEDGENAYENPITFTTMPSVNQPFINIDEGKTVFCTGKISGNDLQKRGGGTLVINNPGNDQQQTYVKEGFLQVETKGALSGEVDISPRGVLILNLTGDTNATTISNKVGLESDGDDHPIIKVLSGTNNIAGQINGDSFRKQGVGELVLKNSNNGYNGFLFIDEGTLTIEQVGALPEESVKIADGATFAAARQALTVTNNINIGTDSIILVKSDANSLILEGAITGTSFIKQGPSSLILKSNNAHDYENLAIVEGAVSFESLNTLPENTLTFKAGNPVTAVFPFNDLSFNKLVIEQGANSTIDNTADIGINEVVFGSGSTLTKTGLGTLTISNLTGWAVLDIQQSSVKIESMTTPLTIGENQLRGSGEEFEYQGPADLRIEGEQPFTGQVLVSGVEILDLAPGFSNSPASLGGGLLISDNVRLIGGGTIKGDLISDNGILSPGTEQDNKGTLRIEGIYEQDSDRVDPNPIVEVQISPIPTQDRIDVVGDVNLNNIGTLALVLEEPSGLYEPGLEYIVINSETGQINGQFAAVNSNNFPIQFEVEYRNNNTLSNNLAGGSVVIVITQGGAIFPNLPPGNARNVARYLETYPLDPAATEAFQQLFTLDEPELIDALDQISAQRFGAVLFDQFNIQERVSDLFASHLKHYLVPDGCCIASADYGVWVQVFGARMQQKEKRKRIPHDTNDLGVAAGFGWSVNDQLALGSALAYSNGELDWAGGRGSGKIEAVHFGINGLWGYDRYFIDLGVQGAWNRVKTYRRIIYARTLKEADASFGDYSLGASCEMGLDYHLVDSWMIQPHGKVHLSWISQDTFEEKGAEFFNLKVRKTNYVFGRGRLGLKLYKSKVHNRACFTYGIYSALQYDHTLTDGRMRAKLFEYCPDHSFVTRIYQGGQVYGLGQGFVNYNYKRFDGSLKIRYTAGSKYDEVSFAVGGNYQF